MKNVKTTRGICRYCSCSDSQACNPPCYWVDLGHTICSSPSCVRKARSEGRNIKAMKNSETLRITGEE